VSLLAAAKARYTQAARDARQQATVNLRDVTTVPFELSEWSARSEVAFREQWPQDARNPDLAWNWSAIHQNLRSDPSKFDITIWTPENRLSGLAAATLKNTCVALDFLEGDPRQDCPLKGLRALIVLEAVQCYGLATGRTEIRIEPANEALAILYQEIYGFALATPRGDGAYYKREIT
jgi:hypothetical protein